MSLTASPSKSHTIMSTQVSPRHCGRGRTAVECEFQGMGLAGGHLGGRPLHELTLPILSTTNLLGGDANAPENGVSTQTPHLMEVRREAADGFAQLSFLRTRPQLFTSAPFCLVSPFKEALSLSLLAQAGPGVCREPVASSLQAEAQSQHALRLRSAPSLR